MRSSLRKSALPLALLSLGAGLWYALQSAPLPALAAKKPAADWGVYRGGGCDGTAAMAQFVRWFGQRPPRGLDFFSTQSWQELSNTARWSIGCWDEAGHPRMTFSIPMLVDDQVSSLAKGAAGAYDDVFTGIAEELVRRDYGDAIIRTGWEFNGDWMRWSALGHEREYIAYFRRIVTAMRAVPGAHFKFDWTVANADSKQKPADAYPGDAYVDIIGLDVYNQSWSWTVVTAEQRWKELVENANGLAWQKKFAAAHNKPLSFPEWGTGTRPDGHGAGDDARFIEGMATWIAHNRVAYHDYWDYPAPDYDGELSAGRRPLAGAAFLRSFGGSR